jgi:hypothetical protein
MEITVNQIDEKFTEIDVKTLGMLFDVPETVPARFFHFAD